jgi:hypothetical protein
LALTVAVHDGPRPILVATKIGHLRQRRSLKGEMWEPVSRSLRWGIGTNPRGVTQMNGVIYLVGLIVVVIAILSFFGLR